MFDSIKHWFDSLGRQSHLFEHSDDEILHSALASVLYHMLRADQHLGVREKHEFQRILKQEFELDDGQVEHLYLAAKGSSAGIHSDWHSDLHTINFYLKHNPAVRMTFMRKLLQLIDADGVDARELDIFYQTLHEVFPEVKVMEGDEEL
jgi:uncharacterized tellurite resistance protein B-like protein